MKFTLIISSLLASTSIAFQAPVVARSSSIQLYAQTTTVEPLNMLSDIERNYYKNTDKAEPTYDDVMLDLTIQTARLAKIQAAMEQGLESVPTPASGIAGLSAMEDKWATGSAYPTKQFSDIEAQFAAKKKEVAELKSKLEVLSPSNKSSLAMA